MGRDTRLNFGDYKIVKILKKEVIIRTTGQQQDQFIDRRIPRPDLERIRVCNELLHGKPFALCEFFVNKDNVLTGNYKGDNSLPASRNYAITDAQTDEERLVNFSKLVKHLTEKNWFSDLQEKDIVTINNKHMSYISKVKANNSSGQELPEGRYIIKGFTGAKIILSNQNGTVLPHGQQGSGALFSNEFAKLSYYLLHLMSPGIYLHKERGLLRYERGDERKQLPLEDIRGVHYCYREGNPH